MGSGDETNTEHVMWEGRGLNALLNCPTDLLNCREGDGWKVFNCVVLSFCSPHTGGQSGFANFESTFQTKPEEPQTVGMSALQFRQYYIHYAVNLEMFVG